MLRIALFLIFVCISVSAQTDLTNVNKVELNGTTQTAKITVDGPNPVQVLRIRTNEAGAGDFGIVSFWQENEFEDLSGMIEGPPRRRLQDMKIGYNVPGSIGHVPTESNFTLAWEMNYVTSLGRPQNEFWMGAGVPGFPDWRPIGIDTYLDDGTTQVGIFSQSFVVGDPVTGVPWARFESADPGFRALRLVGDGRLDFSGNTREYFIGSAGTGLMGKGVNQFNLFQGGIEGETINVLKGSNSNNAPLTLKVGEGSLKLDSGKWKANNFIILTSADADSAATPAKLALRDTAGMLDVTGVKIGGVEALTGRCENVTEPVDKSDVGRAVKEVIRCLVQINLMEAPQIPFKGDE